MSKQFDIKNNPYDVLLSKSIKDEKILEQVKNWDKKTTEYLINHYGENSKDIISNIRKFEEYKIFEENQNKIEIKNLIFAFKTEFLIPYLDVYKGNTEMFSTIEVMSLGDVNDIEKAISELDG